MVEGGETMSIFIFGLLIAAHAAFALFVYDEAGMSLGLSRQIKQLDERYRQ
jgi:hypothetical protein